jgi:hypothetical protein
MMARHAAYMLMARSGHYNAAERADLVTIGAVEFCEKDEGGIG